jgi:rare lipoprotein A
MRFLKHLAISMLIMGGLPAMAAEPAAGIPPAPQAAPAAAPAPAAAATVGSETGLAAVYSDKLNGHKTASGKIYNRNKLTAAHKTLPFGTKVRVTNTKNGKSVELVINDRGPRQPDRILDISPAAARALGIPRNAMREVSLDVVGSGN